MIGGFFCVPSTKKRTPAKGNADKSKKAKKGKSGKSELALRKFVRGAQQGGSTKKRKTSGSKTKRRSSLKKGKDNKNVNTKHHSRSKSSKQQRGGATIVHDLTDGLGRGSYPVTKQGHDDCSGVHHK